MSSRGAPGLEVPEVPVMQFHRSLIKALRVYNSDRLGWMETAAAKGPIVGFRFGPITPVYVVSDPVAARSVLISDSSSWKRSLVTTVPSRLAAVGDFLFTQSDKSWAKIQPALAPEFRKRSLEPRLVEARALMEEEIGALPHDTTIDLDQAMGRLTMIVAVWVLFGQSLDRDRADELAANQRAVIDWVGERVGTLSAPIPFAPGRVGRKMRRHRQAAYAFAAELIEARRGDGRRHGDVLDALLAARPGGRPLSDSQLKSQVLGMFGAGNETTAAALGWAMVHGSANPKEWAALRSDPSLAQHYVAETLRLSPPGWGMIRVPAKSGAYVPIGAGRLPVSRLRSIVINIWGMNRDSKTWEDPSSFIPDRHRELTKDQERSLLPFGLGPRGCIGQHLAMTEMISALPLLARHGEIEIEGEAVEHPIFTLRVLGGLRGRFAKVPADSSP